MAEIEYFYSAHSAFAYLGSRRFIEIARGAGRRVVHKPYDLRRGIAGVGHSATTERPTRHRAYFFGREIERWSEQRNAPVMAGMPTHHWHDPGLANCILIAGARRDVDVDTLAHGMLAAHWRDDADLADPGALGRIMESVGIAPAPLLTAAGTAEIRTIYDANTAEAIDRSVFGSPTYFVDGDMFYGQDHLEMVERALHHPYKGQWPR